MRHFDNNTFRTETNSSDIKGVSGTRVSFADFGGTGVSYSDAEFPVRGRDTVRETVTEWQVIAAKLLARDSKEGTDRTRVDLVAQISILIVLTQTQDFAAARSSQPYRGRPMLTKPFQMDGLKQMLQSALGYR